jgi:hypothetical protein
LYGDSLGYLSQTALALHTAGYTDRDQLGPQVGLIDGPFWNRAVTGFLHNISPGPHVPDAASGYGYLGPVYLHATYGDVLRTWVTWEGIQVFGPVAVLHDRLGNPGAADAARWILSDALEGGADRRFERAARIWGNGLASDAILSFLAFAPSAEAPRDPRPSLPLTFLDTAYGRLPTR